jgi:hypothetical protein
VIVAISNDELPDSVYGHTSQAIKLAITIAISAKLFEKRPVCVEDLNAMIR